MNDFTVIYRILKIFQAAMDYDEFDPDAISAERLKVSENKLDKLLIMLVKNGYIEGVTVKKSVLSPLPEVRIEPSAAITLKGLEYLEDNSMMKKAAKIVKGIADVIPH